MQKLLFKWQPSSIQAPNWEMMHTLWFTITRFCFNKKLISNNLKHCLKLLYRIAEWFPTRFLWGCALWERGISLRIKLMKGEEQSVLLALLGGAFWLPFVFRMETFSPRLPQWEMSCLVTPHWLGAVVLRAIPRRSLHVNEMAVGSTTLRGFRLYRELQVSIQKLQGPWYCGSFICPPACYIFSFFTHIIICLQSGNIKPLKKWRLKYW